MTTLLQEVQDVLVEMTRYPADLFTPEADFEDELGIDSVKLAEIYGAMQKRFGLDEDLVLEANKIRNTADLLAFIDNQKKRLHSSNPEPPTVAKVITRLAGSANQPNRLTTNTWIHGQEPQQPAPIAAVPEPSGSPQTPTVDRTEIIKVLAEVTRYPADLFTDEADLEDDLGVDSVKQAEILTVLAQRFHLPNTGDDDFGDLRTVGDVLNKITATAPVAQTAPSPFVTSPQRGTSEDSNIAALLNPAAHAKPFAGKVVFVTGSGHGIGATIATRLATMGATLIVNSFHSRDQGEATAEAIRQQGGQAHHIWGSAAKQDHLERMFKEIENTYGGLDFFINNASNGLIAPLETIQPQHWEKAFRTNVIGLHQGALLAAKLMAKRGGGRIIALSSPGAQRTIEHFGCMGPVKAAVESLVRYLAVAFKDQNITVNAVSAGPVQGDLLDKYPDAATLVPRWRELSLGDALMTADDVANAVVYLLSPLASKVSGSVHLVDGTVSLRI